MRSIVKKVTFLAILLSTAMAVELALDTNIVVSTADARLGRPATPASVAGVARRTTRRTIRRTAVFVTALPAGCQTLVIDGVSLHQCGGTYYQASGSQYVVVNVN